MSEGSVEQIQDEPTHHRGEISTIQSFFQEELEVDADAEARVLDWLILPEQEVLSLITGRVFYAQAGKFLAPQKGENYIDKVVRCTILSMDAIAFSTVLCEIVANSFPVAAVLVLAAALDYLIGDPWGWPHPVRVMGWIISHFTQFALKLWTGQDEAEQAQSNFKGQTSKAGESTDSNTQQEVFSNIFAAKSSVTQWQRRWAGIVLGIGLIMSSGLTGWFIVQGAYWIHPFLGVAVESILLASCLAGRSLRIAAVDVLQPLAAGQLDQARSQLSQYVGRDTEKLDEPEILRAVLETVTENATDGVTAPLFYAIVGAFLPGVGSVPLALAYKAASTLDSMVGYRVEPYTDLGWFSAKLEDVLTWLPCRFTVVTLALLSGKPQQVWRLCLRDAPKDSSPNSGWSECTYAAILGVQLGGTNWYQGVAKYKPLLGDPLDPITPGKIYQALGLTRYCILIWLAVAVLMAIFLTSKP